MKKYFSGLITGILAVGLLTTALAASGNVSFNLSAIKFNGEVISEAGEGYTLSNGCVAPASITYTDEKGGGTTYLPVRRIGELAGVTIGWDGAVVVESAKQDPDVKPEQPATPDVTPAPDTTAKADYSDWSAEDEAAYQEFKGMWKYDPNIRDGYDILIVTYNGDIDCPGLVNQLKEKYDESVLLKFGLRIYDEVSDKKYQNEHLNFKWGNRILFAVYPEQEIGYGSAWSAGH